MLTESKLFLKSSNERFSSFVALTLCRFFFYHLGQSYANCNLYTKCCFLNDLPKTSIFYRKDFLLKRRNIFSLFLRQMLTHMVFCSTNGCGIFNEKLPVIFLVWPTWRWAVSHMACFLKKVALVNPKRDSYKNSPSGFDQWYWSSIHRKLYINLCISYWIECKILNWY